LRIVTNRTDWEDQRAFLAVLDTGSLSGAARRLGVAQPTVRHRIETLERFLGVVLFTRSTGGLMPTEQVRSLGAHVRRMASASEAFVRAASAPADMVAGTVRFSAAEMVGVEVLPAMLAALRAKHPALAIELSLSNVSEDVLSQEVDIAVRMHPPVQESLVAKRLGFVPISFFAHRDYVKRRGSPATIEELPDFDLIGSDRSLVDLQLDVKLSRALERKAFAFRTDSHPAQLAAIRAGLGIGITHTAIGNREPLLVHILPEITFYRFETWIVTHEDLRQVARIRATFDHLVEERKRYASPQ
jgi:DNA-binding transcriptional LysR family regulator